MARAPYAKSTSKRSPRVTSQSKPIPGRESEMKKNLAGGFAFKADDWQAVRRWLLTGSMGNAFYQGKDKMTEENAHLMRTVLKEDPIRTASEVLDASKKAISVHTPIYALAEMASGDKAAINAFKEIFPLVIRNASQLYARSEEHTSELQSQR